MAEHRIEFMQLVHTPRDLFNAYTEFVRQLVLLRVIAWQEFVQRRIEKADRGRQPFQGCKDPDEIATLVGE